MRVPTILTISLLLVATVGTAALTCAPGEELSLSFRVTSIIQIWVAAAALISAVFVIYSYTLTNQAFIASQMPHLLVQVRDYPIQVVRDSESKEKVHTTQICYENRSQNPFFDLSLIVHVRSHGKAVNLSDLFVRGMYMAPGDSRQRNFVTKDTLKHRGFDLDEAIRSQHSVELSISYEFRFGRKMKKVNVQSYVWEDGPQTWSIEHRAAEQGAAADADKRGLLSLATRPRR